MEDEERRALALTQAVKLTSEQQIGKLRADLTLNIARAFEGYLKGDDRAAHNEPERPLE